MWGNLPFLSMGCGIGIPHAQEPSFLLVDPIPKDCYKLMVNW